MKWKVLVLVAFLCIEESERDVVNSLLDNLAGFLDSGRAVIGARSSNVNQ